MKTIIILGMLFGMVSNAVASISSDKWWPGEKDPKCEYTYSCNLEEKTVVWFANENIDAICSDKIFDADDEEYKVCLNGENK